MTGKKIAGQVSRALREAGLPKAGRYTTWGYETDGFIVRNAFQGGATVMFTLRHDEGRKIYHRALVALHEAGWDAESAGRPGVGGTYSIFVSGKSPAPGPDGVS